MKDPIKINDLNYIARNAHVRGVSVNATAFVVHVETSDANVHDVVFPVTPGIAGDLCRILEVSNLGGAWDEEDPARVYVRALSLHSPSDPVTAISHLLHPFGLSMFDYYLDGEFEKGLLKEFETSQSSAFVMATLAPPPGLPWTIVPEPGHPNPPEGYVNHYSRLIDKDGVELASIRKRHLADWLVKAQIAGAQSSPPSGE